MGIVTSTTKQVLVTEGVVNSVPKIVLIKGTGWPVGMARATVSTTRILTISVTAMQVMIAM
jgi:hypothetical protein